MAKKKKPAKTTKPAKTKKAMKIPPPGLDGSYSGSCVACMRGTDSALSVLGEAEAAIAAIMVLADVDEDHATETLRASTGCQPGEVPNGMRQWPLKVCEDCAGKVGWKVADPRLGPVPSYSPPG